MGLELYLDLLSSPCRAVFIFLEKNQIPFDFQPVNLLQGEHGSSEFASVNSLGRLPTLKDGDFTLKESVAILLYLCREYNTEDHWYPEDGQARARVDEYLSWQHLAIHDLCSKILWLKVLFPYFTDQPVLQNKLDDALAELEANLQQLEEQFLQDQSFIAGDDISLADLVAIVELMQVITVLVKRLLCIKHCSKKKWSSG
uniref:glutathione transferase n=1 Tax=Ornithorhynchus anatinus TaxID=9258 RepID=F7G6U6_ORNAN